MKQKLLIAWLAIAVPIFVAAQAYTAYTYMAITHSTVDSSPIGSVTPSTGSFTSLSWTGTATGNAATATALLTTPTQCSGDEYSTGIAADGNANCSGAFTGGSGYQALPSGLIVEWVTGPSEGANFSGSVTLTLPLTLPHACLTAQLSTVTPSAPSGNGSAYGAYEESCSTGSISVYMDVGPDGVGSASHSAQALVVGY